MPRILPVSSDAADPRSKEMLDGAEQKLGMIPNLFSTLAHSPAALDAYLTLGNALSNGVLSATTRENIALTLAGANECAYCASAHSAIGRSLDIEPAELTRNLLAESEDPKTAAILGLTRSILDTRGAVSDAELDRARAAGISDAEIAEIVANVALNVLTNYFNRLAETDIDFPVVTLETVADHAGLEASASVV